MILENVAVYFILFWLIENYQSKDAGVANPITDRSE